MKRMLALLVLALAAVALRVRAAEPARAEAACARSDPRRIAPLATAARPVLAPSATAISPTDAREPATLRVEGLRAPRSARHAVRFRQRAEEEMVERRTVEPSMDHRFGPPVDLFPSASCQQVSRRAWALTAVNRSRAELRSARGRQSDP